jgi:hypothetical protein
MDIPFLPPIKKRRRRDEDQIQRAVFTHLRTRGAPGVFAFHPANGGKRNAIEGAKFKAMGVVAGVPDVIALKDCRFYALELKAEFGKVSEKQLDAMRAMQNAGAIVAVAHGLDAALHKLEEWGLLRGRV